MRAMWKPRYDIFSALLRSFRGANQANVSRPRRSQVTSSLFSTTPSSSLYVTQVIISKFISKFIFS